MVQERDSQRSKVYAAEKMISIFTDNGDMPLDEVKTWISKILNSRWTKGRYYFTHCVGDVKIKDGRGTRWARGGASVMNLPCWSRSRLVILHELAHVIQYREYHWTVAGHGREFCSIYLALVYRWIGKEAGDNLKAAFKDKKVKFVKSKKRERRFRQWMELSSI